MTTSLEIEPVMNMSNSAEMTTVGGGGEGLQAILLEQQQCAVSWDQHWIQSESMLLLYSNDESHFVTFYSYFGSHKLWLFTVILDTGGDIGGWKSQIVTFYSYFGYWGGYRRVVTICVNWGRCIYHVKSHYNPPAIICCRQQIHTEYSWWSVDIV